MFAYTLNPDTWQMESTEAIEPKPKKKYNKKTREPGISLVDAFNQKYPGWHYVLDEFTEAVGGHKPTWRILTKSNLVKFVDHLKTKFAPNTVNQYATRLKAVLNIYSEEIDLPKKWSQILSPRKVASTAIFLNEAELKLIEGYNPKDDHERLVRNLFVCSAYTGARCLDIMNLNESNIRGNEIVFIAQKTHKEARLPLKPIVAEYIRTMPKLTITNVGYNKIISRICKNVGISEPVKILKAGEEKEMPKYEAVSSHTARRSFATNLYLRGVDIYTISKLLQHSDIKLTTKYICVGIRQLDEAAKSYFD